MIEAGDRVTYKNRYNPVNDNDIKVRLVLNELHVEEFNTMIRNNDIEILKIERPNWEVVEEKKELLTEAERELLKAYLKLGSKYVTNDKFKEMSRETTCLRIWGENSICFDIKIPESSFKNIDKEIMYTLKELGLED